MRKERVEGGWAAGRRRRYLAAGRICVAQSLPSLGAARARRRSASSRQGSAVRSAGLCVDCLTWAWTCANAAMLLDRTCICVMYDEPTCRLRYPFSNELAMPMSNPVGDMRRPSPKNNSRVSPYDCHEARSSSLSPTSLVLAQTSRKYCPKECHRSSRRPRLDLYLLAS
jgi:hypothetical protein